METIITAHIPENLVKIAQAYISSGWIKDMDSLISEALRRYIESHSLDLNATFVKEDIEWGLRGKE